MNEKEKKEQLFFMKCWNRAEKQQNFLCSETVPDRAGKLSVLDRTDSYGAGLSGLFLSGCCAAVYPV